MITITVEVYYPDSAPLPVPLWNEVSHACRSASIGALKKEVARLASADPGKVRCVPQTLMEDTAVDGMGRAVPEWARVEGKAYRTKSMPKIQDDWHVDRAGKLVPPRIRVHVDASDLPPKPETIAGLSDIADNAAIARAIKWLGAHFRTTDVKLVGVIKPKAEKEIA